MNRVASHPLLECFRLKIGQKAKGDPYTSKIFWRNFFNRKGKKGIILVQPQPLAKPNMALGLVKSMARSLVLILDFLMDQIQKMKLTCVIDCFLCSKSLNKVSELLVALCATRCFVPICVSNLKKDEPEPAFIFYSNITQSILQWLIFNLP